MSKRFREFSRLYWERRPPRLHPAMRARMWKPGESGNPSGVSKAYAEAVREMSTQRIEPSPGARRTRRWRWRKQHGGVVVSLDVSPDLTDKLIRCGWLNEDARGDKEAIATALVSLAEKAIELEATPGVALAT
jgi:hypothetical protein